MDTAGMFKIFIRRMRKSSEFAKAEKAWQGGEEIVPQKTQLNKHDRFSRAVSTLTVSTA
jgi:hypothetical protein